MQNLAIWGSRISRETIKRRPVRASRTFLAVWALLYLPGAEALCARGGLDGEQ